MFPQRINSLRQSLSSRTNFSVIHIPLSALPILQCLQIKQDFFFFVYDNLSYVISINFPKSMTCFSYPLFITPRVWLTILVSSKFLILFWMIWLCSIIHHYCIHKLFHHACRPLFSQLPTVQLGWATQNCISSFPIKHLLFFRSPVAFQATWTISVCYLIGQEFIAFNLFTQEIVGLDCMNALTPLHLSSKWMKTVATLQTSGTPSRQGCFIFGYTAIYASLSYVIISYFHSFEDSNLMLHKQKYFHNNSIAMQVGNQN